MRPDLTGVWKLVCSESDFGFLPPPQLRVDTISHDDPQLRIRTRQKDANGDITVDRELTIAGEPITVVIHNRERKIRAFRDEDTLVLETRFEVSGNARRIEDRISLDNRGEWITVQRLHEQPGGAVRQRLRLQKSDEAMPFRG